MHISAGASGLQGAVPVLAAAHYVALAYSKAVYADCAAGDRSRIIEITAPRRRFIPHGTGGYLQCDICGVACVCVPDADGAAGGAGIQAFGDVAVKNYGA